MPRRSRPERLIQELQDWRDDELEDLAAMITGLLQSRQQEVEDASQEKREDGTPLGRHGGRGHIELKLIPDAKTGKTNSLSKGYRCYSNFVGFRQHLWQAFTNWTL